MFSGIVQGQSCSLKIVRTGNSDESIAQVLLLQEDEDDENNNDTRGREGGGSAGRSMWRVFEARRDRVVALRPEWAYPEGSSHPAL
jgi:hypothetical protein